MCGLVGFAGDLAFKDESTMKRMLLLDYLRGEDSTGMAAVRASGDIKLGKIASHPIDLFLNKRFQDALDGNNSKVFIGHNRAATRGAITTYNAHPFVFDNIVGAHNGTLDAASTLAVEKELKEQFPVDSMALFAAIDRLGIKETIKLIRTGKDGTTGAWALVWYDKRDNTLNFLRNKWRPLWYCWDKDFKKLLFASEWPMIKGATDMGFGYEIEPDDDGHKYYQFQEDFHYKFDIAAIIAGSDKRPKPLLTHMEAKEMSSYTAQYGGRYSEEHPFVQASPTLSVNKTTSVIGKKTTKESGKDSASSVTNVIHLIGDLRNPLGGYIKRTAFEDIAKFGCSWCGQTVEYEDEGIVVIERDSTVICADCVKKDRVTEDIQSTRIIVRRDLYM